MSELSKARIRELDTFRSFLQTPEEVNQVSTINSVDYERQISRLLAQKKVLVGALEWLTKCPFDSLARNAAKQALESCK